MLEFSNPYSDGLPSSSSDDAGAAKIIRSGLSVSGGSPFFEMNAKYLVDQFRVVNPNGNFLQWMKKKFQ